MHALHRLPLKPFWLFFLVLLTTTHLRASQALRVGVASNFQHTFQAIIQDCNTHNPALCQRIQIVTASTGKLLALIQEGAPLDMAMLADNSIDYAPWRDYFLQDSVWTYALGQLALWMPFQSSVDNPLCWLKQSPPKTVALANPLYAPYGKAAWQALQHYGIDTTDWTLLKGANVNQSMAMLLNGGLDAGFVALSQFLHYQQLHPHDAKAQIKRLWLLPSTSYQPIVQKAGILRTSKNIDQANALKTYLQSARVRAVIQSAGYQATCPNGKPLAKNKNTLLCPPNTQRNRIQPLPACARDEHLAYIQKTPAFSLHRGDDHD